VNVHRCLVALLGSLAIALTLALSSVLRPMTAVGAPRLQVSLTPMAFAYLPYVVNQYSPPEVTNSPTATATPTSRPAQPTIGSNTPTPTATDTPTPRPPCIPSLISPESGAVLDNGRTDRMDDIVWDFDWSDCEGDALYRLLVVGPPSIEPVIDAIISDSSYHYVCEGCYIREVDRYAWKWIVRAQVDGQWGEWSELRTFSVEPVNSDAPSP